MPRYRRKPYQKQTFESTGTSSDTSANIYMSMLTSAAWRELTARQCKLYLYCKAQYYAEKKKPIKDDRKSFTMNQSKWNGLYGLYTKNNRKYFYQDMEALISKGFIVCLESGANTRTKSIYRFCDIWQEYGIPEFNILIKKTNEELRVETQERILKRINFGK